MGRLKPRVVGAQGPMGVDLGHHSLKLAQLEITKDGWRVCAIARTPTPPGAFDEAGWLVQPDRLRDALGRLAERFKFRGHDAYASLSGPLVVIRELIVRSVDWLTVDE